MVITIKAIVNSSIIIIMTVTIVIQLLIQQHKD